MLAESQLALGNYPSAEEALTNKRVTVLSGELEWKRRDLLCHVLVARKDYEAAARESAGLVAAAVPAVRAVAASQRPSTTSTIPRPHSPRTPT